MTEKSSTTIVTNQSDGTDAEGKPIKLSSGAASVMKGETKPAAAKSAVKVDGEIKPPLAARADKPDLLQLAATIASGAVMLTLPGAVTHCHTPAQVAKASLALARALLDEAAASA